MGKDGEDTSAAKHTKQKTMPLPSPNNIAIAPLDLNANNLPLMWKNFVTRLKIYMRANGLEEEPNARKVAILLQCIGVEALNIFYSFNTDMDTAHYDDLINKFEAYFMPKVNISMERHKLFNRRQQDDEDISTYATELQNISFQCDFGQVRDSLIRDIFSWNLGSKNAYIREHILNQKPKSFEDAVELAKNIEYTKRHAQILNNTDQQFVGAIESRERYRQKSRGSPNQQMSSRTSNQGTSSNTTCSRCGQVHRVRCPAMGAICKKCKKPNHFAVVCRSTFSQGVHNIQQSEDSQEEGQDQNLFLGTLYILQTGNNNNNPFKTQLHVNNVKVDFLLDTGADTNILSYSTFQKLQATEKIEIQKSQHKLSTFSGEVLPSVGQCKLKVNYNSNTFYVNFHIVDLPCQNIIGRSSCHDLNLVKRVHNVKLNQNPVDTNLVSKYSDVFDGIGCLTDFECHLTLKPDAAPSVDVCRRVPFGLVKDLEKELKQLERNGIIVKVEEPTEWVSSIVLTSKKDGKLRLCIDPRKLNEAIMRSHYQFPTIDEIKNSLAGAQYFSTLDANKGFWMLKLDEASSKLCTFIAPQGRYRFLRLPFGINAAPEIFHREMTKRFGDIEGVKILMDDLLIYAPTKIEHDIRLEKVLQRARDINLRFNNSKSAICQREVKYLGHIFSGNGVRVDESKVKAIVNMSTPTNITELQRFLGMITYLGSYIENLSLKTANLRMLLSKNTIWNWTDKHDMEFKNLKDAITQCPVLTYYDPNKDIALSVDSSKDSMGAVILHEKQPIAYASASLTPTQQSYSQIEKELLAILFGCTKFHQYIYGRQTLVETDHKPIVSLFKKPLYAIPPRLQRIMLRLQPYSLTVTYKPGKYLYVADTLSRSALPEHTLTDLDTDLDLHINLIVNSLAVSPMKFKEIQEHTKNDNTLCLIKEFCQKGWPEHRRSLPEPVKPYFALKDVIHVMQDVVFKLNSIIIPVSLRNDVLKLIHEGHQGIQSCQRLARGSVYWPNLNSDIEKYVSMCQICLTYRRNNSKQPLMPHDYKLLPWNKVGIDLFDLNGKKYLIVVDYFSKYIELAYLPTGSKSDIVITHLKSIFARHGIPNIMISDNGPPFNSKEFQKFNLEWDIEHITSSPYHSQSNGLVERSIATVKNILRKCSADNSDPYLAILQYRNTPKDTMCSPAQLSMSRTLRSKIPTSQKTLKPKLCTNLKEYIKTKSQKTQLYFNQHTKKLKPLNNGDQVFFKKRPNDGVWTPGIVSESGPEPRSFTITTPEGVFRRNREHVLKPKYQWSDHVLVHSNDGCPNVNNVPPLSSPQPYERCSSFGRPIRRPVRYREE